MEISKIEGEIEAPVREVLREVGASLSAHAGGIELVAVDQAAGIVTVRFTGTCTHCPLSAYTLAHAVEAPLKQRLPWVQHVKVM